MDCLMTNLGGMQVRYWYQSTSTGTWQVRYRVQVGTGTVGTYPYLPRWYLQLVLINIFPQDFLEFIAQYPKTDVKVMIGDNLAAHLSPYVTELCDEWNIRFVAYWYWYLWQVRYPIPIQYRGIRSGRYRYRQVPVPVGTYGTVPIWQVRYVGRQVPTVGGTVLCDKMRRKKT